MRIMIHHVKPKSTWILVEPFFAASTARHAEILRLFATWRSAILPVSVLAGRLHDNLKSVVSNGFPLFIFMKTAFICRPGDTTGINAVLPVLAAQADSGAPSSPVQRRGRSTVLHRNPTFLVKLTQFFENAGVTSDPRLASEVVFTAQHTTLEKARAYLANANINVSRSTVYNYLRPRRIGTHAANTHSMFALPIRARVPTRDGKNLARPDDYFCNSLFKAIKLVFASQLDRVLVLSRDDKARVFFTSSNVRRPGQHWTVDLSTSFDCDAHDFQQTRELSCTLTGFLEMQACEDVGFRPKSGHYFAKQSHSTQLSQFNVTLQLLATRPKPDALILLVDGGPDETPKSKRNKMLYALMCEALDLEFVLVFKFEPGGSKKNPVERLHCTANRALSGISILNESSVRTWTTLTESHRDAAYREVCSRLCQMSYGGKSITAELASTDCWVDGLEHMAGTFRIQEPFNALRKKWGLPRLTSLEASHLESTVASSVAIDHLLVVEGSTPTRSVRNLFGPDFLLILKHLLLPTQSSDSMRYMAARDKLQMSFEEVRCLQPAPLPSSVVHDFCAIRRSRADGLITDSEWSWLITKCGWRTFRHEELASLRKLVENKAKSRQ